jgi:hypothetical protein
MQPTTIGLDLAKHVFQVHAVAADGKVLVRRKLRRSEVRDFFAKQPPCLVGKPAPARISGLGNCSGWVSVAVTPRGYDG